jgi:hypothetical protein
MEIGKSIQRETLLAECHRALMKSFDYIKAQLSPDDLKTFEEKPDLLWVRNRYPELTDIVNELIILWRNIKEIKTISLPPMPPITNN